MSLDGELLRGPGTRGPQCQTAAVARATKPGADWPRVALVQLLLRGDVMHRELILEIMD